MTTFEWHFRLKGEALDIADILQLFESEVRLIHDGDVSTMVLDLPHNADEFQLADTAGLELLAKLNAITKTIHPNHANVTIAGISLKGGAGTQTHQFISGVASIRSSFRAGVPSIVVPGTATTRATKLGDKWLAIAESNEYLERAAYLFGSLAPDWRTLYLVLEAAEDGNGGEKGLIAKRWVPDGQIKDFKATANSYKALRLAARHGSTKGGINNARMTSAEAEEMVRTILEKWIKSLV